MRYKWYDYKDIIKIMVESKRKVERNILNVIVYERF